MKNFVKRENIAEGVCFTTINDDRFKSERIAVNMIMPLESETASKNAIIPFILRRSSGEFDTYAKLNSALSNLYGAEIYPDIKKFGETQVMTISASFLNERYTLHNERLLPDISKLLCDMIFRPNTENSGFITENVEQEKRQLIDALNSEYNDKRIYARRRCEQLMCSDEKFSIHELGTIEQLQNLDSKSLLENWEYILQHAKIEIMFLGENNANPVKETFKKEFSQIKRENIVNIQTEVIEKPKGEAKEHIDKENVQQAKLVMGYRTKITIKDDNSMATRLMVGLLGGTPHSKLFVNVREKLSLCYYCSSVYYRVKGIMFVQSGVESKNLEKTKTAIQEQIEEIKAGNFTQNELDAVRLSMENAFSSSTDSLGGLESWYLSQLFENKIKSVDDAILELKSITKEDIIKAASYLSLDTTYILTSKGVDNIE